MMLEISSEDQHDLLSSAVQVSNVLCTGNPPRVIVTRPAIRGRRQRSEDGMSNCESSETQGKKVILVSNSVRYTTEGHFARMVEKRD